MFSRGAFQLQSFCDFVNLSNLTELKYLWCFSKRANQESTPLDISLLSLMKSQYSCYCLSKILNVTNEIWSIKKDRLRLKYFSAFFLLLAHFKMFLVINFPSDFGCCKLQFYRNNFYPKHIQNNQNWSNSVPRTPDSLVPSEKLWEIQIKISFSA